MATKTTKASKKNAKPSKNGKAERAPRAKKEGLRAGQLRILEVLSKTKRMPRRKLLDAAGIGSQGNDVLGTLTAGPDQGGKDWGFPSLLMLGFVNERIVETDAGKEKNYEMTGPGRTAFKKAQAEAKAAK